MGMGPGPADPQKVPYYLMIVGEPEEIPFKFQFQLDVQYAVGRLPFVTPKELDIYARTVVAVEKGEITMPRDLAFFGAANQDDRSTRLSTDHLVRPLAEHFTQTRPDWNVQAHLEEAANRDRLTSLLGGEHTPSLLFSASHGMSFPNKDNRQLSHQGALLCSDWPGPREWKGSIPQDFYVAGDNLCSGDSPRGMISFFFACYGAGVPRYDDFSKRAFSKKKEIAPHSFISDLPRRMLGHPGGGALAVVGYVDRTWGYSFFWAPG